MDPLSMSASIITVVASGGQIAKGIRRLASLKGAPDVVLALSNEITDLNLVILTIQDVYQSQRTSTIRNQPLDTHVNNSVMSGLDQANQTVTNLQTLYDRLNKASAGSLGLRALDKTTWLLEQRKVTRLHEDLRNARLKLATVLEILNSSALLHVESSVHGLYSRISNLDAHQQQSMTTSDQRAIQHNPGLQNSIAQIHAAQQRLQLRLDVVEATNIARFAEATAATAAPIAAQTDLAHSDITGPSVRLTSNTVQSSIKITVSSPGFWCVRGCTCSCHDRKTMKLRFLDRFIGSLFIGYLGLPYITLNCDDQLCRKRASPQVLATYLFPSWLLARAVLIALKLNKPAGPELNLRVYPIVDESSAIFYLCSRGDMEGVTALLQQGLASLYDVRFDSGLTPLMDAVYHSHFELCKVLLHAGADPLQEDFTNRNAIDHFWLRRLGSQHVPRNSDAIHSLFNNDPLEDWNLNQVHKAVLKLGAIDLPTAIQGVSRRNINERDKHGRTPLLWATTRSDVPAVSLLIHHGANVDAMDNSKMTALMGALRVGGNECARVLLDAGADVTRIDSYGWLPLHYCCYYGCSVNILETILSSGVHVDTGIRGDDEVSGLCLAAQEGHVQICDFLLSQGAAINKANNLGETPLHLALYSLIPETTRLLLRSKADVRLKTKAGESLIHVAAQFSNIECFQVLRSFKLNGLDPEDKVAGVSLTQRSNKIVGRTALEIAEQRRDASPEWLEEFRKLIRSVEAANSRSFAEGLEAGEGEGFEEFEDAPEYQDTSQ